MPYVLVAIGIGSFWLGFFFGLIAFSLMDFAKERSRTRPLMREEPPPRRPTFADLGHVFDADGVCKKCSQPRDLAYAMMARCPAAPVLLAILMLLPAVAYAEPGNYAAASVRERTSAVRLRQAREAAVLAHDLAADPRPLMREYVAAVRAWERDRTPAALVRVQVLSDAAWRLWATRRLAALDDPRAQVAYDRLADAAEARAYHRAYETASYPVRAPRGARGE